MLMLIKRNLLKNIMTADGVFSLVAGAAFVALSAPISALIGPVMGETAVLAIGVFLIGWGIFHLAAARPASVAPMAAWLAIAGDAAWVVASTVLLIAGWDGLTAFGVAAVATVAIAVADIMLLKLIGLNGRQRAAMA